MVTTMAKRDNNWSCMSFHGKGYKKRRLQYFALASMNALIPEHC